MLYVLYPPIVSLSFLFFLTHHKTHTSAIRAVGHQQRVEQESRRRAESKEKNTGKKAVGHQQRVEQASRRRAEKRTKRKKIGKRL